ncbi:uncharacterized protein [Miscanthus floridulus]|uniref:uncharacterized protein n=1 Tax=Miscanthus floridulus TaxID=154761 RepID=UPI00345808A2
MGDGSLEGAWYPLEPFHCEKADRRHAEHKGGGAILGEFKPNYKSIICREMHAKRQYQTHPHLYHHIMEGVDVCPDHLGSSSREVNLGACFLCDMKPTSSF